MRKLLLGTAAVALGMSFVAGEANAQVKLDVSGHTKMYGVWLDQDETGNDPATVNVDESEEARSLDILRDTEIHFTGETTLDNGLTVGFHTEAEADGPVTTAANDSFAVQESYAYFSGAWGRVNLGAEDGAAYLLQVSAPSADSNIDGLRQWVQPVNYGILTAGGLATANITDDQTFDDLFSTGINVAGVGVVIDVDGDDANSAGDIKYNGGAFAAVTASTRFDYDHALSGNDNKLTYMTPVFNGFQAGVSYTPQSTTNDDTNQGLAGVNNDDDVGDYGDVFDLAARWEGTFDQLGIAVGGGWSHAELERQSITAGAGFNGGSADPVFFIDADNDDAYSAGDTPLATLDDREMWNVGIDLDWQAFGLGAAYLEDDNGISGDALETETWVIGVDYTTGPFKLGASYYDQETAFQGAEIETDRWTGGVVYTYGPGMTFRGSVSYIEHEENVGFENDEVDATSVLLGTQINF